jgi:hypothetical protein
LTYPNVSWVAPSGQVVSAVSCWRGRVSKPSVPEVSPYQPVLLGKPRAYASPSTGVSLAYSHAWCHLVSIRRAPAVVFKHTDSEAWGREVESEGRVTCLCLVGAYDRLRSSKRARRPKWRRVSPKLPSSYRFRAEGPRRGDVRASVGDHGSQGQARTDSPGRRRWPKQSKNRTNTQTISPFTLFRKQSQYTCFRSVAYSPFSY